MGCIFSTDNTVLSRAIFDLQKTNNLLVVAWEKNEKDLNLDDEEVVVKAETNNI